MEDITTLNISGVDKQREYYILNPLYMTASTVYIPVDTQKGSLRNVLSKEMAQELIRSIPGIPLITITNDKMLEQEYKNCLKTNRCEEWIKIIKTIYLRRQKRLESGRKCTAVDTKYFRIAQECLYGELAVSLGMPRESVETYITGEIDKQVCV